MTNLDSLYAAVMADREDDTVRLVYADELEETGDRDRAEFIRLQCESAKCNCWPGTVCRGVQGFAGVVSCAGLRNRANDLLNAHPEWSQLKCPFCVGGSSRREEFETTHYDGLSGSFYSAGIIRRCGACGGSGDLLHWMQANRGGDYNRLPREVVFRRGFIDSVACRLDEVASYFTVPSRDVDGDGWVFNLNATTWARAVAGMVPITRLVLRDRVPDEVRHGGKRLYAFDSWGDLGDYPHYVHDSILSLFRGTETSPGQRGRESIDEAKEALAVAAYEFVRREI